MNPAAPTEQTLGSYRLIERVARGGMGEIWRGERLGAGGVRRRVALKRILPEYEREPTLRERFVAEARINARLEHPNVVQLIDFGDAPELYLVLEYIEGLSLADLMRRAVTAQRRLPVAACLYIVAEAATGLDYAHRRKDDEGRPLEIVHRDVSPPNILLSVDGAVKVNDFGIARAADNILRTQAGLAVGKLVYMAPEQARGERVDRRADVWALGVVLWEMLVLRPLFPRDSPGAALEATQRGNVAPPSSFVPGLSAHVDDIVRGALQTDLNLRTPSAGRFASQIRAVLHQLAPGFEGRDIARLIAELAPDLTARSGADPQTPVGALFDASGRISSPPVPAAPMAAPVPVSAASDAHRLAQNAGPHFAATALAPGVGVAISATGAAAPALSHARPRMDSRAAQSAAGAAGGVSDSRLGHTAVAPAVAAPAIATVGPAHSAATHAPDPPGSIAAPGAAAGAGLPQTREMVALPPKRGWLWALVGAVIAVLALATFMVWRSINDDSSGDSPSSGGASLNVRVAAAVGHYGRNCAGQLSVSGASIGSGVAQVTAVYEPSGLPSALHVEVDQTPRNVEVARCIVAMMRANPIAPPPPVSQPLVPPLVVTF